MEIVNLSDAEFKTLVIRTFRKMIEYGNCIKNTQAEMKITLSEIKNNLQGTNSGGEDEAEIQTNELEHKEEINIQPEQKEETRIQNNEGKLRMLWDISKCANI